MHLLKHKGIHFLNSAYDTPSMEHSEGGAQETPAWSGEGLCVTTSQDWGIQLP